MWEVEYNGCDLEKKINSACTELHKGPVKRLLWGKEIFLRTGIGRFKICLEKGFGTKGLLVLWSSQPQDYICVEPVQFDWEEGMTVDQLPPGRISEPDFLGNRRVEVKWSITVEELF